ncbi:hypothetical protein BCU70_09895 [Vibrio sp. 10N.286.49.C2]|uniref:HlyD family secretion protein n=1 Tax=unclassified Vibrio TaxID=2614977 RepID=UPI000C851AFD|nr:MULTISPECIES: efflux RND transporter periplasmic adaptor subunit [unclassified Vibrio]PMH26451.1 hypothetical protein BCU70_09895 [Vibrio sp. 10N.286.49.C2]PMH54825.1 hypothetical protein BCU66_11040 [Vibrio sp. 10N.286.49.B1]PMH82081.1 hypothetical protein BCU58_19275 [Vibrio sp. 10N.286.48.B7]
MNLRNATNTIGKTTLAILFMFGASMVLSDIHAPFTTNAYLQKEVVSVTAEVAGIVDNVYIKNGHFVKKGEPIFSIDKQELVENKDIALANMIIIKQHLDNLEVEIAIAKTQIKKQKEEVDNNKKHYERYKTLYRNRTISQEKYDDSRMAYLDSQRELEAKELELTSKEIKLGVGDKNGTLMLAEALLEKSDRKIAKSVTYAPVDGWVTNLQLDIGESIDTKAPQVAMTIGTNTDLVANFNEKALPLLSNAPVLVVFDALPGKVFSGQIESRDSAVQIAQSSSNNIGYEALVQRDNRWIRQSQQVRTTIRIDNVPDTLVSGSKSTVMIQPEDSPFWSAFTSCVMHFISIFRYIY